MTSMETFIIHLSCLAFLVLSAAYALPINEKENDMAWSNLHTVNEDTIQNERLQYVREKRSPTYFNLPMKSEMSSKNWNNLPLQRPSRLESICSGKNTALSLDNSNSRLYSFCVMLSNLMKLRARHTARGLNSDEDESSSAIDDITTSDKRSRLSINGALKSLSDMLQAKAPRPDVDDVDNDMLYRKILSMG